MLILSRKPGDAILIDGGIRIEVVAGEGGGVRLGIDAPREIAIVREEIVVDIADENLRAGGKAPDARWVDAFQPRPRSGGAKAAGNHDGTSGN